LQTNLMDTFSVRDLQHWIEKTYVPVVLLRTTPDVESSCAKNKLSFIDILRPYEVYQKELYTRTIKEYEPFALKDFTIRFKTLDDLSYVYGPDGNATNVQQATVQQRMKEYDDFLGAVVRDSYNPVLNEYTPNSNINYTPWFDKFREEYLLGLRSSEHECFEHPVAVLSVVSTANPDPISSLNQLYNPENPPRLFQDKLMDREIFRFFILLHDESNGQTDNKTQAIFRRMKEVFGAGFCRLLIINSRNPHKALEEPMQDIWTRCMPRYDFYKRNLQAQAEQQMMQMQQQLGTTESTPPSDFAQLIQQPTQTTPIGYLLSKQDLQYIATMVEELVTNGIVPHMERKIRGYNQTAVAGKRGFQNKLKTIFSFGKKDTKGENQPVSPVGLGSGGDIVTTRLNWQSPEIQIRRMADYCFMLHDYDVALATYRLISSDFKNYKQDWKFYAGTQEFIALCTLFQTKEKKDAEAAFDIAYSHYKAVNENKLALRATLFQAMLYKSRNDLRKAAETFTRGSNVEDANFFQAALLFEQTAFCYIQMEMARKFALFLVLAGYRYSHSGQIQHSYRCYYMALKFYYRREWDQIYEHMSITMGRLSNFMGDLKSSVVFMHDFISTCTQLPDNQKKFLSEFLVTVKGYLANTSTKEQAFDFLDMPKVNTTNLRVLLNQYGVPSYSDQVPEGNWRRMERNLVKSIRGKMFLFPWENPLNLNKKKNACVVGEPILVEVSLFNSLFIPLNVTYVRLTASFEPKQPHQATTDSTNHSELDGPLLGATTRYFKADPIAMVLNPRERKQVRLSIIALAEGELNIEGIRWQIEGLVEGVKKFQLKGRRLNDTKQHRTSVVYEEDNRLNLKIIAAMPLLSIEMRDMPPVIYNGQLHKSVMVIKNIGSMGMKGLVCKLSHPMLFAFGTEHINGNATFPVLENVTVDGSVSIIKTGQPTTKLQENLSIIHIPFHSTEEYRRDSIESAEEAVNSDQVMHSGILAPNESMEIPIYVRGSIVGLHDVQFLFYYESEVHNHDIRFRLYRHSIGLRVIDSIRLRTFAQPSLQNVDEFILGLQIKNNILLTSSPSTDNNDNIATININQLTAVSPMWTFTPLNFSATDDKLRITAQESSTLYLRIHKRPSLDDQDTENKDLYHNTMYIAPPQGKTFMYHDTTASPHIDLLFRDCTVLPDTISNVPVILTQTGKLVAPPPVSGIDSFMDEPISLSDNRSIKKEQKKVQLKTQLPNKFMDSTNAINEDEDEEPHFSFMDKHGMSLMVFWSVSTSSSSASNYGSIVGQSHALRLNFVPSRDSGIDVHVASKTPWQVQPECPLAVTLEYQDKIDHNFGKDFYCFANVLFQVKNISADMQCDFTLELLPPTYTPTVQPGINALNTSTHLQQQATNAFLWMGMTRVQSKGLLPGQTVLVPVKACFFAPGYFNLNQFRITWVVRDERQPDEMATRLTMSFTDMQYLLSVQNKGSNEEEVSLQ
jgi:hypothetical protein